MRALSTINNSITDNLSTPRKKSFYPVLEAFITEEEYEKSKEELGEIWLKQTEIKDYEIFPNQYISLKVEGREKLIYLRYIAPDKPLQYLNNWGNVSGIKAKNNEQAMAIDLLMDPSVNLVTLSGIAGSGKTLMALVAAIHQLDKRYDKIVISRPNVSMGKELGFLPGTVNEKMLNGGWLDSFKDNIVQILNKKSGRKQLNGQQLMDGYLNSGQLEIQALSLIRGRTIDNACIIIDEIQNCSLDELKSIISRSGKGTTCVLIGDVYQRDIHDGGIEVVIDRFKKYSIAGHVDLLKGERSPLATLAAEIL